jgi:hypothetical protein
MAQESQIEKTRGFFNGRAWYKLPLPAKLMYISGLRDGRVIAGAVILQAASKQTQRELDEHEAKGFTAGDFVREIDDFYKDPANIRIPMMYGYEYANLKFKGRSAAELEEVISDWRKWAVGLN